MAKAETKEAPFDYEASLRIIAAWQKRYEVNDSRLSLHACANSNALKRIKEGGGTTRSLRQILEYIRRYPEGPFLFDE